MRQIYDALTGKSPTLEWSNELEKAFTAAKEALAHDTLLVHPHADKPTALTVDASGTAIGAVLEQNSLHWQPVAFFSRTLRPAEHNNKYGDLLGTCEMQCGFKEKGSTNMCPFW